MITHAIHEHNDGTQLNRQYDIFDYDLPSIDYDVPGIIDDIVSEIFAESNEADVSAAEETTVTEPQPPTEAITNVSPIKSETDQAANTAATKVTTTATKATTAVTKATTVKT